VRSPSIRSGAVDDASKLSELVRGLSEEYILGEFPVEARARFLADHSEEKLRERLSGDFRFYVAELDEAVAGVAALRSNIHLFYLFVGNAHRRAGLARRLWSQVMAESLALGNPGRFTVNASNYAVPAYERLGFRRTGSTKQTNGVLYNPMELVVSKDGGVE
jgi:GNAT superfamily N-acetyltransferase